MNFPCNILLLVLFSLGLLGVQPNMYSLSYEDLPSDDDVLSETKEKFQDLQKNVNGNIADANGNLRNNSEQLKNTIDSVNAQADDDCSTTESTILTNYKELRDKYVNNTEKLDKCAIPFERGLGELASKIAPLIKTCTSSKQSALSNIINLASTQLESLITPLSATEVAISECMFMGAKQECLRGVQDTISILDSDISSSIESIRKEQEDVLNAHTESVQGCASERVKIIESLGNQLLDQITSCIENEISTTPPPPEPTTTLPPPPPEPTTTLSPPIK